MSSQKCLRCGSKLLPNARFCGQCTFPATFENPVGLKEGEWRTQEHEFAVRIRPQQVKAWLTKGINVDESQTGLLFENGRFEHELKPGRQKLETLPDRIRKQITGETASAVLIRQGLFPLSILGTALTPEGDDVNFDCEIGIQVADRNAFYLNLMQSTDFVSSGDLMQRLAAPARQAIIGVIATCASRELLNIHPELQQRLVDSVTEALSSVVARIGLAISYVSPPSFSNEQLFKFQQARAEIVRDLRDRNLQHRYNNAKDEIEIRRFQASHILEEARLQDEIKKAERTGEFEKLKAELHYTQQLQGMQLQESMDSAIDSLEARKRERQETKEDAGSLRAQLLAVVEIQRQQELATAQHSFQKQALLQEQDLDDAGRTHRLKVLDEELAAEQSRLEKIQIGEIGRMQREQRAQREERLADATSEAQVNQVTGESRRSEQSQEFEQELSQRQSGLAQDVVESQAKIDLEAAKLRTLSETQAEHLARLQTIEQKNREMEAAAASSEHQLSEDSKDREHKRKIEELQLLKDSPEMMQLLRMAEISVQSPAMTESFGEVMKMAMAKGMTAEQLELVAAQQSPDVARALQEKYRAQALSTEQQQESYERIISELKSSQELSQQQVTEFMNRLERVGISGQDMLRDVGGAAGSRTNEKTDSIENDQLKSLIEKVEALKEKLDQQTSNDPL